MEPLEAGRELWARAGSTVPIEESTASPLKPDRAEAERYLAALVGTASAAVSFQTFDDDKKKRRELACVLHGPLHQHWDDLVRLNRAGAGIFVMVNEGDREGRTEANVRALRAVFVDDDSGELTPTALELVTPSLVVQSRNGIHAYWRLRSGEPLEQFKPAQAALAETLHTDRGVKDLPRVMRLPGFLHQKDPAGPFLVRVVQTSDVEYSIAEILDGYGATVKDQAKGASQRRFAGPETTEVRHRASTYLAEMDAAIEGEDGSGKLWAAAQAMVRGFNHGPAMIELPEHIVFQLLSAEYNPRCIGPWSENEIRYKIRGAIEKSSVPWGYILDEDFPLPTPTARDGDPASPIVAVGAEFIPFSGSGGQAFPIEVLPAWLASYVQAVSRHIQVPVDGPALSVIAAVAAVVAKRVRVRRVADGYEQPLNLYLLGLGEPGERKSQIVSEVTRPLRDYETRVAEDMQERVVKAAAKRRFEEERAKYLRRGLAAGKIKGREAELRAELDAIELELAKPLLKPPRLVTSAPTQGALEQLLAENGERMAILGAEGGVFGIVAGRFSGNAKAPPDMDILLSGWSGDPSDSDRKMTQGARLKAPAITIGLFVQPQVFLEISNIYGADEKGLTSRFLVAMVESNAHRQKYIGEPMDEVRRAGWRTRIAELFDSFPADAEEKVITLPSSVLRPAEAFFDEVTAEMAPGGPLTLPALRAFGSKLRGQVERLIGILHVARHGADAPDIPVAEETVEAAVALARYFLAHGKAVRSAMAIDETIARAQRLIEHCVFNRIASFKRRDAQMNHWGGCRNPKDLEAALAELKQRGYLTARSGAFHLRPELLP